MTRHFIWLAAISWLASGCAAQARSPEPVPVDHVQCARCGMVVSTETGAGEILESGEDTRFYDDVGCLAADWHDRAGARAFVRLGDGVWTDVTTASFARPRDAKTAMGSGIVAFATIAEARAADRDGRAWTWDAIRRLQGEAR